MSANLPIVLGLAAWLACTAAVGSEPAPAGVPNRAAVPSRAAVLVSSAITELERHDTISAKIRHRVNLLGHAMTGSGVYLQGSWRERLLRLELKMQVDDKLTTLQQVCDGRHLWVHQELLDGPGLGRIDVARVIEAIEGSAGTGDAEAAVGSLALGGLPRLLSGLETAFSFTTARQSRLADNNVWIVRGEWKADQLPRLLPDQAEALAAGAPADLDQLADHLPDHVMLYLGQEDLFPYRIEYRRSRPVKAKSTGEGSASASKTLVAIDLFDVQVDVPIDNVQFAYTPGSTPYTDLTAEYLKTLGVAEKPSEE